MALRLTNPSVVLLHMIDCLETVSRTERALIACESLSTLLTYTLAHTYRSGTRTATASTTTHHAWCTPGRLLANSKARRSHTKVKQPFTVAYPLPFSSGRWYHHPLLPRLTPTFANETYQSITPCSIRRDHNRRSTAAGFLLLPFFRRRVSGTTALINEAYDGITCSTHIFAVKNE